MGHTLPTVTQGYQRFLSYLAPYRRALRKSDQLALDALLDEGNQHLPAAGYAANLVPGVAFLLSLLLEKHKQAQRHEAEFEKMRSELCQELQKLRQESAAQLSQLKTELLLLKVKLRNGAER